MNGGRRVPHDHLRRVVRGNSILWRELREPSQQRCLTPYWLIEAPVDACIRVEAGNVDVHLAGGADVCAGRFIGPGMRCSDRDKQCNYVKEHGWLCARRS